LFEALQNMNIVTHRTETAFFARRKGLHCHLKSQICGVIDTAQLPKEPSHLYNHRHRPKT
jgi:hypothetical protein